MAPFLTDIQPGQVVTIFDSDRLIIRHNPGDLFYDVELFGEDNLITYASIAITRGVASCVMQYTPRNADGHYFSDPLVRSDVLTISNCIPGGHLYRYLSTRFQIFRNNMTFQDILYLFVANYLLSYGLPRVLILDDVLMFRNPVLVRLMADLDIPIEYIST